MSEIADRRGCHDAEKHWGVRRCDTPRREADRLCSYARPPVRCAPCGIHVVSAVRPEYRSDYYVIGEKAIRALLAERKAADEAVTSNVRRRFEAISAKRDLSAEFRVIRRGGPDEDLTLSSLHSDLVVIGQRELQELKGYASPETLLLSSGSPILVIPSGWKSGSIGNKVLVGWNARR